MGPCVQERLPRASAQAIGAGARPSLRSCRRWEVRPGDLPLLKSAMLCWDPGWAWVWRSKARKQTGSTQQAEGSSPELLERQ